MTPSSYVEPLPPFDDTLLLHAPWPAVAAHFDFDGGVASARVDSMGSAVVRIDVDTDPALPLLLSFDPFPCSTQERTHIPIPADATIRVANQSPMEGADSLRHFLLHYLLLNPMPAAAQAPSAIDGEACSPMETIGAGCSDSNDP